MSTQKNSIERINYLIIKCQIILIRCKDNYSTKLTTKMSQFKMLYRHAQYSAIVRKPTNYYY